LSRHLLDLNTLLALLDPLHVFHEATRVTSFVQTIFRCSILTI
jgi:hypothetical protein